MTFKGLYNYLPNYSPDLQCSFSSEFADSPLLLEYKHASTIATSYLLFLLLLKLFSRSPQNLLSTFTEGFLCLNVISSERPCSTSQFNRALDNHTPSFISSLLISTTTHHDPSKEGNSVPSHIWAKTLKKTDTKCFIKGSYEQIVVEEK